MTRTALHLTLAGTLALPMSAMAASTSTDLDAKYEKLQQEMEALKDQMQELKDDTEEQLTAVDEKAEKWDLASRFELSGDFRSRLDYVSADTAEFYSASQVADGVATFYSFGPILSDPTDSNHPAGTYAGAVGMLTDLFDAAGITLTMPEFGAMVTTLNGGSDTVPDFVSFMQQFTPAQRAIIFNGMGYATSPETRYDNDSLWTNRVRLNIRAKALENVEFKGRLSMYKAWGMQNNPVDVMGGPFTLNSISMDGNLTRTPSDSALYVDRAFVNWNNIGDAPVWFSIGRRPTTDGPPAHFKQGRDERMATPVAYMDYAFDGISLGYAYPELPGLPPDAFGPGRVRICYGRGFEAGPAVASTGLKDTDFLGISWDVFQKGSRFFNVQSFAAFDMFNVPDNVTFGNPLEMAFDEGNGILDRANLGNIYHTSAVYTDKVASLNYFAAGGWSRTAPRNQDEVGNGLLTSWWDKDYEAAKDGYSAYVGVRYDLADLGLKLGLEYNYGSKNWIAFTPGNDDLYASKLAVRGHVGEAYMIWSIPGGEKISKFADAFIRLGYQHYQYEYTGSGFWLGEPQDINDLKNDPLTAQFYTPVDDMDQVYLTFEATF
jgi:hypothetical protein